MTLQNPPVPYLAHFQVMSGPTIATLFDVIVHDTQTDLHFVLGTWAEEPATHIAQLRLRRLSVPDVEGTREIELYAESEGNDYRYRGLYDSAGKGRLSRERLPKRQ
ncbi:MAG: hypothetical protein WAZ14_00705 [Patescibacteria group bacterium]